MHALERMAALLRAAAILALLLTLSGVAGWPNASAQDDEQTEPPAPEGVLVIRTAVCTVEAEPPAPVAILTEDELAQQPGCAEGPPAFVSVDDFEAFEAPSGMEVALAVGPHTLTDANSGTSRGFEIVEAATSTLVVTTYEVVLPTETPTEVPADEPAPEEISEPAVEAAAPTGSVTLVTHLCRQGIATPDELAAVDTWGKQLVACPVVVLAKDFPAVTGDAVTANDPTAPLAYDQTVAYDGASVPRSLGDGTFAQESVCESNLGETLNGVEGDDRCYDQSGYAFPDIPAGPVTIASTDAPGEDLDEFTFLTAKSDPTSDDAGAIESIDEGAATVSLDTDGDPAVTVHLFFASGVEDRVKVVGHVCAQAIQSTDDLDGEGDIYAKLLACPSVTLQEDEAPEPGETVGNRTFNVTLQGSDGVPRAVADLEFAPATICERDLPTDIDGVPTNDRCLDESGYVAEGVPQGEVGVTVTRPASKTRFLTMEVGPNDEATFVGDRTAELTTVDTTEDGDVVIHVFFARNPVATATPTKTATPRATRTATPRPTRTATPRPTRTSTPRPVATATRTPVPTATPTLAISDPATSTPARTPAATTTPTSGGGTGSVKILKFVCVGSESQSRINVLEPGQAAGRGDLGDATCQNANIQSAKLVLADGSTRDAAIPPDGFRTFTDIPTTEGNNLHTFDDTRWGLRARFAVERDEQTVLVSLTYEPGLDMVDDLPIDRPNFGDEPTALPTGVDGSGESEVIDGEGVPNPVENPAADPFGNVEDPAADPFGSVEDDMTAEEIAEEERAAAEVAKVDKGEDLPTVGTARATPGVTPLWLILTGLGVVGVGLVTGRRRHTGVR